MTKDIKIKVIGIGNGGCSAVNNMIQSGLTGVEFWAINTDAQLLERSAAPNKIQIGENLTNGLGTGGDPSIGEKAAEESKKEIIKALEGADMVFVSAGLGGGTGSGAAPVVAKIAKTLGILTVVIVTIPFEFEGKRRGAQAVQGLEKLKDSVDSLIVIPNQKLIENVDGRYTLKDAFKMVDEVLLHSVKSISDIITIPNLINIEFADIKSALTSNSAAVIGYGKASGENRAIKAARQAINSPLLENLIKDAKNIIINISGGADMSLQEAGEATLVINDAVDENAAITWGTIIDEHAGGELQVTIIATGFDKKYKIGGLKL